MTTFEIYRTSSLSDAMLDDPIAILYSTVDYAASARMVK